MAWAWFEAYAREHLSALFSPSTRRDLDRLVVKLAWKLQVEFSLTRTGADRTSVLEAFSRELAKVKQRQLEVEPPLVERKRYSSSV